MINNNQIIAQTNHDMVLQHFIQNLGKENKSKISGIFYAINGSIIKCLIVLNVNMIFKLIFFLYSFGRNMEIYNKKISKSI